MVVPRGLIALQRSYNGHGSTIGGKVPPVVLQLLPMFEGPVRQAVELALKQLEKLPHQKCDKVMCDCAISSIDLSDCPASVINITNSELATLALLSVHCSSAIDQVCS
jgi:hypothetical protein